MTDLPDRKVAFWQALVLGICAMQVGPNMAISAGYQLHVSGRYAWFALACAVAVASLVAVAIAVLARQVIATGSILSYVRLTLPRWAILLTAATLLLGYVLGPASNTLGASMYVASFLIEMGLPEAGALASICLIVAVLCAVGLYCAYRGIALSAKVVFVLGLACIPVAILITVLAAGSYGYDVRPELAVQHQPWGDLARGVFTALGFFIGFDGVTTIAASTSQPKRNVSRILFWSLAIPGVLTTLAALYQTPVLLSQMQAIDAGESANSILARAGGILRLDVVSDVLLCAAAIAGQIGWLNFSAMIIATAAKDGFLPPALSKLDARRGTPLNAALFLTVVSVVIAVVIETQTRSSAILAVLYITNMLVLLWLIPYILVSVAAITSERRHGRALSARSVASASGAAILAVLLATTLLSPADAVAQATNWITVSLVLVSFGILYAVNRNSPTLKLVGED